MTALWQDVRYGLRLLKETPGLTAVAVFTLALGIAANTTVFSWVDSTLLHPFTGAEDSGRLAVLEMFTPGAPRDQSRAHERAAMPAEEARSREARSKKTEVTADYSEVAR